MFSVRTCPISEFSLISTSLCNIFQRVKRRS